MAQKLVVEIVGDASSLERTFRKTSRDAKKFQVSIGGVGKAMTRSLAVAGAGFFGAQGLINGLKGSVDAASDLNEQMSKTRAVFGHSSQQLVDWSKTTAAAFGVSQRQALATASSFGALFAPMGIVGDQAAQQSRKLTELGADLASFYNTDVQDALDAIKSGLVGEVEPLRRYGALLSESRVQAEAMAETGKKTAASLTAQEKAAARMNLIFKDTKIAQGDVARTQDAFAGQMRKLTAQIDDMKASLGEALLPVLTEVVTKFNKWLEDPENKQKILDGWTTAIHDIGAAAEFTAGAIDKMVGARNNIKDWDKKGPSGIDIFKGVAGALGWTEAVKGIGGDLGIGGGGKTGGGGFGAFVGAGLGMVRNIEDVGILLGGQAGRDLLTGTTATGGGGKAGGKGATAGQRNQWFDAMITRLLGRASDPTSLRQQISRLRTISGLIQQRLAATKDVTRRLTLEDQLADIAVEIRSRQQQINQNALQAEKDAAELLKQRAAKVKEQQVHAVDVAVARAGLTATLEDDLAAARRMLAVLKAQHADALDIIAAQKSIQDIQTQQAQQRKTAAENARQKKATRREARLEDRLGWLMFGAERAEATKTLKDDLRTQRAIEAYWKSRIAHEGRKLRFAEELWRTQQRIRELNKKTTDPLAGLVQVSSTRMAALLGAGLGLSGGQRGMLAANIAGQEIHNYVHLDGREVARSVNRTNARGARRTANQTSGHRG